MKLFFNRNSPYARKVLIAVHEKGILDRVELCETDPWRDPPELLAANPASKVPALLTEKAGAIIESTTICDYLDGAFEGRPLVGPDRAAVMARAGLAEAVIDAAFTAVIEKRRPPERQWTDWVDRQLRAVQRTLAAMVAPPEGRFDLGDIALAAALGYLDFRLSATEWRERHEALAAWLDSVSQRPSMQQTQP